MPAFSARLTRSMWPASRTLLRFRAGAPVGSLTRLMVRAGAGRALALLSADMTDLDLLDRLRASGRLIRLRIQIVTDRGAQAGRRSRPARLLAADASGI